MADEPAAQVAEPEAKAPATQEALVKEVAAPKEPPVDWEAKYKADIAERDKQVADLRAHQIAGMTQREREAYLAQLPAIAETQKLILKALSEGVPEDMAAQLAAIEQKGQEAVQTEEFTEQVNKVGREVWGIGDSLGLDPNAAPEFKNAALYFRQAQDTGDAYWLGQAVAEAERARSKIQAERHKAELAEVRTQAQKKAREEAGVLDLSGGKEAAAPGSTLADEALVKAVAAGTIKLTPAIDKRMHEYWDR